MTIAFVSKASADAGTVNGSTGTTLTITSSGAGNQGIVILRLGTTSGAPVITDNGAGGGGTWNSVNTVTDSTNTDVEICFLCTNLKTATTVLTLKFTGNKTVRWAYHEYSVGAGNTLATDKTSNLAQTAAAGSGHTITSNATATTTNANELLLGYYKTEQASSQPSGATTAGGSYTIRVDTINKLVTEDQVVSATGAYTATWTTTSTWLTETNTNAVWAVVQTFFEQAPAGGYVPYDIPHSSQHQSVMAM